MKSLKYSSRGSLVSALQLALCRAGFPVEIDGIFGTGTQEAVMALQRSRSIPVTGEVTQPLWYALEPLLSSCYIHTLRRGDTLSAIAQSHSSSIEAIDIANPGIDPLALSPGGRLSIPLPFEPVPGIEWSTYFNSLVMRALTCRYPFLRQATFGRSVMGRPLRYLAFGEGERTGIFTAAHHANEWITAPALLKYVSSLAGAYAKGDQEAQNIYQNTRLYFIPLVNPDGVDLVTGALDEGFYSERAQEIAAGYPDVPFPNGWKANIRGTDLNLQYPAGWDQAKEIKFAQGWVSPAPRDYVGASPLSASESRALYSLTRQLSPKLALALHTQGEVIYWQYQGYAPEDAEEVAGKLAAASGYALDTVPDESSFAGYKDWVIDSLDTPAFTVECGLGESPLPLEQLGSISTAVAAICRECAQYIATG